MNTEIFFLYCQNYFENNENSINKKFINIISNIFKIQNLNICEKKELNIFIDSLDKSKFNILNNENKYIINNIEKNIYYHYDNNYNKNYILFNIINNNIICKFKSVKIIGTKEIVYLFKTNIEQFISNLNDFNFYILFNYYFNYISNYISNFLVRVTYSFLLFFHNLSFYWFEW